MGGKRPDESAASETSEDESSATSESSASGTSMSSTSDGLSSTSGTSTSTSTTKVVRPDDTLFNIPEMGYTANFGMIDTHYYLNQSKNPETAVDQGGPGVTKVEEQKRAAALNEARSKMAPSTVQASSGEALDGRSIYVVRNGERLDRLFPEWLELGFTPEGKYRPYDLNHPLSMPKRPGGKEEFRDDGPITEVGYVASQMVGRAIRLTKIDFAAVYVSPALRCVQTAHGIMKTLGSDHLARVEPGLFEYTGWYKGSVPKWLTPAEMKKAGYKVDPDYKPVMTAAEVGKGESCRDHHDRVYRVTRQLMDRSPGNVLIVGHGTTLDGVARSLLGYKSTEVMPKHMDKMGSQYPYTSVIGLREKAGVWKVIQDALPPVSYVGFTNRVKTDFLNRP